MAGDKYKLSESAAQLFCRLGSKQSLDGLDDKLFQDLPRSIQPGDVVELYGKEGCGKTQILLHLVANCILPRTWHGLQLDGRGVGVLYIDTDYHFSLLRLVEILENRINVCMAKSNAGTDRPAQNTQDIQVFVRSCLSRLVLVRCNSSIELVTTVESLDEVFANRPEICVLMIDSVGAFYWLDKSNAGDSAYDQDKYQRRVVALLKKYTQAYYLVVLASKPAIFDRPAKYGKQQKEHNEYMCRDWHDLVKYRYSVTASAFSSTFWFKRIQASARTSLQFSVNKAGLVFAGDCMI